MGERAVETEPTTVSVEVPLRWQVRPAAAVLATVAALALVLPLVVGRPLLLAVAAPLVVLLAAGHRADLPSAVTVTTSFGPRRVVEGEPVAVTVSAATPTPVDAVRLELTPGRHLQATSATAATAVAEPTAEAAWEVTARRWGRHSLGTVHVGLTGGARLFAAQADVVLPTIEVFPVPPPTGAPLVPTDLLHRIGEHAGRVAGEGTEFGGVRVYTPGDRLRRVHWPTTTRRGRLHVSTYAVERAADVVIAVDGFSDASANGAAQGTLDRSLRGAVGLVQAYLRSADRVGVVVLGGGARWFAPGSGPRQWHAVAEALLQARHDPHVVGPLRLPRAAVPPGSLVILLSPLLEEAAVAAVASLRERGSPVVVVDVLVEEPQGGDDPVFELARRLWRLDRQALMHRLAEHGVPVVAWDGGGPVGAALAPLAARPLLGSRP